MWISDGGAVCKISQEYEVTNWPKPSGCFVVLLLETCPFVLQVLSTPFVHFLMGLIVCAAVTKIKMAMVEANMRPIPIVPDHNYSRSYIKNDGGITYWCHEM